MKINPQQHTQSAAPSTKADPTRKLVFSSELAQKVGFPIVTSLGQQVMAKSPLNHKPLNHKRVQRHRPNDPTAQKTKHFRPK